MASSSTTVFDCSGKVNAGTWHGTQAGTTNWYDAGKLGPYAGHFNGTDNYVTLPSANYQITTNVTITAWIYIGSTVGSRGVIFNDRSTSNGISFNVTSTGCGASNQVLFPIVGGGTTTLCGTTVLSNAMWYFVALTVSGSSATLYVNGVAGGTGTLTWTWNNTYVAIGAYPGGTPSSFFPGAINRVQLYNRALSAGEIAQLYLVHN